MMDRMDTAAAVVVYGTALERVASTWDQARRIRHREKTIDIERAVARQAGRTQRLATVARANGGKGKAGAGCDAGGLWRAGRWEDIERCARRDAEVIATLGMQEVVRVPGGGEIREASIRKILRDGMSAAQREEEAEEEKNEANDAGRAANGTQEPAENIARHAEQLRTRDTARTRASQADAAREPMRKARRATCEAGGARTGGEKGANGAAMLQQSGKDTVKVNEAHVTAHADTPHARRAKRGRETPSTYREAGRARAPRKLAYMERTRHTGNKADARRIEMGSLAIARAEKRGRGADAGGEANERATKRARTANTRGTKRTNDRRDEHAQRDQRARRRNGQEATGQHGPHIWDPGG
jgi:hypothetical protein